MQSKLLRDFQLHYGRPAESCAMAPGRIEILGNHTDYNEGIVLSCAVTRRTLAAAAKRTDRLVRVKDLRNGSSGEFSLDAPEKALSPRWLGYVKGVTMELQDRNAAIGGFDLEILSDVPLSAGMSSSAALETAIGLALQKLFSLSFDRAECARIGQGVENHFWGLQSGLLDQFSSIFGEENRMIVSDFRSVQVTQTVPLAPEYALLVVNSMVKHHLVDSAYNSRREQCESAAQKLARRYPGVKTLRDVTPAMLEAAKTDLEELEYRRAFHVVGECDRVKQAVQYLTAGDVIGFGRLLWESHESSRTMFENSTPELDRLVALSHTIPGCLGARLSGGGFGGITIHLVQSAAATDYTRAISRQYLAATGVMPETILCGLGAGATVLPC